MKKRGFKRFYTLIEIMTVIVIAAILFGIGIPAFTTMIQGSNMTIAIRQLSSKIAAARAYAVTNRCKVAVLLPETGVKDDYCYSAYRVCVVDNGNTFQEWIEDENWKTLPKGVLRATLTGTTSVTADATDIGGSNTGYPALIFDSKGRMTGSAGITLKNGRYINGSQIITSNEAAHTLNVNQYSGKVSVKEETGSGS